MSAVTEDIVILIGLKHVVGRRWRAIVLAGIAAVSLSACAIADLKEYGDRVVKAGLSVDEMKKAVGVNPRDWEKPTYHLPNGHAVYVESVGPSVGYKGCDFHWEVNAEGRVRPSETGVGKCTAM